MNYRTVERNDALWRVPDVRDWSPSNYPQAPGFVAGSDTSHAAAESIKPTRKSMLSETLRLLRLNDEGLTSDELERITGWRHQTASARLRELVLLGLAEDSDRRRKTSSGRTATVRVAK